MSTTKPRITVTLEPRVYEVLSRLSAVGGDSMSSLVAQFVTVSLPSLERLVVVLERAAAAPQEARAGLAAAVERAERTLLPALMQAQDMGDLFLSDISEASTRVEVPAPAQRGRAVTPASKPKDPRLVTRGSGGTTKGRKGVQRGTV
jgi:hypothetical protein